MGEFYDFDKDPFEKFLQGLKIGTTPFGMKGAIIDVADTMRGCRKWFESQDLEYTNADLIAMARLILDQPRPK